MTPEQLITVVPADVGYVLLVRAGLDGYRRAHRGENPRVDQVLIDLTMAATRWRELSNPGPNPAPSADTVPPSQWLTTEQAADLVGISARSIRRAIAAGRLTAERVGAGWVLHPDAVKRYRSQRRAA